MTQDKIKNMSHDTVTMMYHALPLEDFNMEMYKAYINMAHKIAHRYHSIEADEVDGYAWECILKTTEKWDSTKAQYITFFNKVFTSRLNRVIKHECAEKRIGHKDNLSLDVEVDEGYSLIDKIESNQFNDTDDRYDELEMVMSRVLCEKDIDILTLYSKGYDFVEISKKYGVSRQSITQRFHRAMDAMRKGYGELSMMEGINL